MQQKDEIMSAATRLITSGAKKVVNKKNVQRIAVSAFEQQIKVLMAAVSTILIHRVIQYLAQRFPKLSFLRMAEDKNMKV